MDEFEIEVTDLRPGKSATRPSTAPHGDEPHGDEPPDVEPLDEPTRAPLLPLAGLRPAVAAVLRGRGRQLRGLGVAAALLLAALIVLTSVPTSRQALVAALNIPTPVPTATLASGVQLIYVTHDAPWGELTIDGKSQPEPRPVQQNGIPYTLARGQHTVEFRAAPFPTLRCRISVPAARDDTCPLDTNQQDPNGPFSTVRILDLGAVPSRLNAADRASLISAANRLLARQQATTTLQPGERYLTLDGTPTTARQPLQATLISTLTPSDPNAPLVNNGQCTPLCDDAFGGPGTPIGGWPVRAQVATIWLYTFPDGQTVEGLGMPGFQGAPSPVVSFTELLATWRDGMGGWNVTLLSQPLGGGVAEPFGSFVCGLANAEFSTLTQDPSSTQIQNTSYQCFTAQNPADGCVIAATPVAPNGIGTSDITDKTMLFLYRFGLLYAANDQAHQALPTLATADEDRQALAHQIVKDSSAGGGG